MYPYIYVLGRNISTYGLCMLAGVVLVMVLSLCRGRRRGLIVEDLLIVGAFALGFALLGGSMLYVFVNYSCAEISVFILAGDWHFLCSGIVFYGGLIGGICDAICGINVAKCGFGLIEYAVVPFVPLGHAVGRMGCVMAGCCYGFQYNGPFALYYKNAITGLSPECGYFPVQILEAALNITICVFLLWYEKKAKRVTDLLFMYLGIYAIARFFLEMLRGDMNRGVWHTISTSQIISLLILAISIMCMVLKKKTTVPQN